MAGDADPAAGSVVPKPAYDVPGISDAGLFLHGLLFASAVAVFVFVRGFFLQIMPGAGLAQAPCVAVELSSFFLSGQTFAARLPAAPASAVFGSAADTDAAGLSDNCFSTSLDGSHGSPELSS